MSVSFTHHTTEPTIMILWINAIALVTRPHPRSKLILLHVQVKLLERSFGASDPESKLLDLTTHHTSLHRRQQSRIVEQDRTRVRCTSFDTTTLVSDESSHLLRQTKKMMDLIDQMRAEIVQSAVPGLVFQLPAVCRAVSRQSRPPDTKMTLTNQVYADRNASQTPPARLDGPPS